MTSPRWTVSATIYPWASGSLRSQERILECVGDLRLFAVNACRPSSVREMLLGPGNHISLLQMDRYTVHSFIHSLIQEIFITFMCSCSSSPWGKGCRDVAQVKHDWGWWKFYREKLILPVISRDGELTTGDWRCMPEVSASHVRENGSVILLATVILLCVIWWGSRSRHLLKPSIFYQLSYFLTSLGAIYTFPNFEYSVIPLKK